VLVNVRTYLVPVASTTFEKLKTINAGVTLGFKIALAASLIKLVWDLWQMVRGTRQAKASCAAMF